MRKLYVINDVTETDLENLSGYLRVFDRQVRRVGLTPYSSTGRCLRRRRTADPQYHWSRESESFGRGRSLYVSQGTFFFQVGVDSVNKHPTENVDKELNNDW